MRPHPTREDASPRIPWLSLLYGFGPMLPLVAGAAAALASAGETRRLIVSLTLLWGGAILTFLSGVRRGLSFRTVGGPTATQIATMMVLFGLGLAALAGLLFGRATATTALLLAGYGLIVVLDPLAARSGEAPRHFARLRPMQIPLALLSLAALLAIELAGRV
ncbi:conserved hypothetical protein [Methylobacterium sp. 4-46]|uniref:DUF3429 domain-containing protein n=1 Tax=unclassified Methylobacterium TaxID=2615210 RepID=UPI000152E7EA|nr:MULTISPECIES: DUF3429 domain-containing protein [Methylobacterium]ACA17173.1 conserved hypothetical protein [Methylobacterium sp. 4-46]WFT82857.1 DUF3429 domain-containing protein [Methylobacterium nodulans]